MEDIDSKEKSHDGESSSHAVGAAHRNRHLHWLKSLKNSIICLTRCGTSVLTDLVK